jgi:hypothetical protein
MADLEDNPLFGVHLSSLDADSSDASSVESHVPVVLDLVEPNYDKWRCFFDAFIGKFGLESHLSSPPTPAQRRDPDWRLRDQCILSWLYNSVSKDVLAIVRVPTPHLDRHPFPIP